MDPEIKEWIMESSGNGLCSFLVKDNGAFWCRIFLFFSGNGVRFFLEMIKVLSCRLFASEDFQ